MEYFILSTVMLIADFGQTRYIAKSHRHYEKNIGLGKQPTLNDVNKYFTGAIALNTGMNIVLPPRHAKKWNKLVIIVQKNMFAENKRLQVGFNYEL